MTQIETVHSGVCAFTQEPFDVFVCENFLDANTFLLLKNFVRSYVNTTKIGQNFDAQQIKGEDGKQTKLMGYFDNRPYRKMWYLPHFPGYWANSKATINEFSYENIKKNVHPIIWKVLQKIKTKLKPFSEGEWIPIRGIMNVLKNGKELGSHFDGDAHLLDMPTEVYTTTLYLNVPSKGGNLWFSDGFVFKVQENALAYFDGNKVYHGVTASVDDNPDFVRLAISIRWVKPDSFLFEADAPLLYPPPENIED